MMTKMIDVINLESITPIDYRCENNEIVATVELNQSPIEACTNCGGSFYKHGQRSNMFADIPIQNQPVRLEVIRPRYRCKNCLTLVTPLLCFIDDKRRATHRLVKFVQDNCLEKTFSELAETTGLAVNTIKSITLDYISKLEKIVLFETPSILGIDEITILDTKRTAVINLSMNCLFDVLPKNNFICFQLFLKDLANKDKVEWIVGGKSLLKHKAEIKEILPNSKFLIIDKSENKLIENYKLSHDLLKHISENLTKVYSFEVIRARLLYNRMGMFVSTLNQTNKKEYGSHLKTILNTMV